MSLNNMQKGIVSITITDIEDIIVGIEYGDYENDQESLEKEIKKLRKRCEVMKETLLKEE